MTERAVRARRDAIRAEYLDEETEAAEAEGLENDQAGPRCGCLLRLPRR